MLFRERQQIVICVAAGVMIGGFVLFRYLPLQRRINAVEQIRATQATAVTKALTESGKLPALKERLDELKKTVGDYQAKVPADRDLGPFLHSVANLMNEHDLMGQQIRPGRELQTGALNCIPVSMQCKGRLKQMFEFFASLQALGRLVRVEQIKLENDRDFGSELSMQAEVVVYYGTEAGQG